MKIYFIAILLLFNPILSFSQSDKVRSLKISYLSDKLNLDPQTAERFWPVYRQYEDEMAAIVREKRQNQNESRSAYDILDQEQKALDIKRKYSEQFSNIIGNNQLNRLYQSEKDFRQMVVQRSMQQQNHEQSRDNYRSGANPNRMGTRRNYEMSAPRDLRNAPMQNNQPTYNSPQRPIRSGNEERGTMNRGGR